MFASVSLAPLLQHYQIPQPHLQPQPKLQQLQLPTTGPADGTPLKASTIVPVCGPLLLALFRKVYLTAA